MKAQASHIVANAMQARDHKGVNSTLDVPLVTHTLLGTGHDASEDGTGRGVPLVFNWQSGGSRDVLSPRSTHTDALGACQTPAVMTRSTVRRLLPIECERLQGFPDDYTAVQYRGKTAADGPRYQALGNSMAVNVMGWIGRKLLACGGEA